MFETKFEKIKSGIINSMGFIAVIMVVAVYMARSFITIGETGKTVAEILADGTFALLFGWGIKILLTYQGALSGMQNTQFQLTMNNHGIVVQKIEPYLPALQTFCEKKNAELRISKRRAILTKKFLKYEDVFCDDPTRLQTAINERLNQISEEATIDAHDVKSWWRRKCIIYKKRSVKRSIMRTVRKANNVHFVALTESALTADGGNGANPFNFPVPLGKHIASKGVKMIFSAFLFAVVFGYYGYQFVKEPSWATVIGGLIQIGSFLIFGTVQFIKEYLYVTDTFRKGIVRKIDLLTQFYEEASKNDGEFIVPEEIIKTKEI